MMRNNMKSFIDRFMVHRLFIGVSNLCLVLAGLYIIGNNENPRYAP